MTQFITGLAIICFVYISKTMTDLLSVGVAFRGLGYPMSADLVSFFMVVCWLVCALFVFYRMIVR